MKITLRRTSLRLSVAGIAMLGALACSQADSATPSDLERDLEQTRIAEMEMANRNAGRTDVVSSVERIPTGDKKPVANAPAPKSAPDSTFITIPDLSTTQRPRPSEPPKPTRKGPYKSTSEVIRNAPFPINP